MKKVQFILSLIIFSSILSGCGNSQRSNIIPDPGGNISDMVNIRDKAQQDVANAIDKKNEEINNVINENNMNNFKAPEANAEILAKFNAAVIKTSMGDINVKLNGTQSPLAVTNFLNLAAANFYNGTKFHRVIKGFMIQGGDPLSKDDNNKSRWGTGGPGYKFVDELNGSEKYPQGTVAMANSGPDTNGSQFFIVTASPEAPLPPSYSVFGQVTGGMDVALKIENVKTTGAPSDRPLENISINSIELLKK